MEFIDVVMLAGKSAVNIALYTLLPIMVIMLIFMTFLEKLGVLDKIIQIFSPILKPFGLNGLSLFALLQLNFVSFVAPFATLALMEQRGVSDRKLAATIAMIFAMGQANVFYPFIPLGLHWGAAILISIVGGLIASSLTYYIFARSLSNQDLSIQSDVIPQDKQPWTIVSVISQAGKDGIKMSINAIPMLVLTLTIVGFLKYLGFIHFLENLLEPLFNLFHIPICYLMPSLVKFFAGGNAYYGVATELLQQHVFNVKIINQSSGFLICMLDLPAIGLIMSLGKRIAYIVKFTMIGAIIGLLFRTIIHIIYFS
ncbi:nucleoside recognition domain-containing protein [Acinetobacter gerneri]|uniref:nucleoside recognition domain-containing protein n=1 Tax=Acinetobacter gerneri TaxID=202952 RepID=UPI0028B055A8|nr:nucleoside recognition domain-containing protein [Acinetobacter gerneri]